MRVGHTLRPCYRWMEKLKQNLVHRCCRRLQASTDDSKALVSVFVISTSMGVFQKDGDTSSIENSGFQAVGSSPVVAK